MTFGETLKEIRTKNGDSLRRLGEKTDIFFTRIDKIEKGTNNINKDILEKLLEVYPNPYDKKKLIIAYIEELLPANAEKNLSDNNIEYIYFKILKTLPVSERIKFYTDILEKVELIALRSGTYDDKKDDIEKAKEIIKTLK